MDETGDLKKGTHTVGVQRQYTGTAGRIENSQVAVDLPYTSRHGHAGIDRALYLPKSWTGDIERREQAAVPDEVGFATKPQLAQQMIERALHVGTPAAWAAGDEVYGDNPKLRAALETRELGYVLAVSCANRIPRSCPPDAARRATAGTTGAGRPHHRPAGRSPAPAEPPQPHHRGAGLLPLLFAPPRPAQHPGQGRGQSLDGGGDVPKFQGTGGT